MEPRRQSALEMAEAATAWLGSLDADQRALAHGSVPSGDDTEDAERRRWSTRPPTTAG